MSEALKHHYGLVFPESFYRFREFAQGLPSGLLREALHVSLEGPFTFDPGEDPPPGHGRYYNDPPEFVTILSGDTDGLHWGYYVDDATDAEFPVASFYARDAFDVSVNGGDVFEALRLFLEHYQRDIEDYIDDNPDTESDNEEYLDSLNLLRSELQKYSTGDRPETGYEYAERYASIIRRKPIARTRDNMGICVPTDLYRPLKGKDRYQEWNYEPTPRQVEWKSAEALSLLQAGYPGAALKLGKDLWIYREHREASYALLEAAYRALNRGWHLRMLHVARDYRAHCDAERARRDAGKEQ